MLGALPVTNALFIGMLVSALLILITQIALARWQSVPRGLQNISEVIIDGVLGSEYGPEVFPTHCDHFSFHPFFELDRAASGIGNGRART